MTNKLLGVIIMKIYMGKVILGFFVLIALFYVITPGPETLAQTRITPTLTQEMTPATDGEDATESSKPVIDEYPLPYPGILPDNPLHFLKALRDRIILMLISDPIKEAEFNLLTSDKRIYAAQLLSDKGKGELALTTLSKSNNYFHNAVSSAAEAKKMGKDIDTVLDTMKKSIIKHQEVLSLMEKKVGKDFSNQLRAEDARMSEFEKSVDNLILK